MYRFILLGAAALLAAQLSAQSSGQPVDGLGLTDGSNPVAANSVAQGSSDHVCVQFALTNIVSTGGSPADFVGLSLNSLGTATPLTDYIGAALYRDSNGNGQVDASEPQLGTWTAMTTVATPWFGPFADTPATYPVATDYLVTLDIAAGATVGAYAEITIGAQDISASAGKTMALGSVQGGRQTIVGGSSGGGGTPAMLVVTTHPGGAVENQVFGTQPVVEVRDSNGQLVSTDNSTQVTAAIKPGTGTTGATLSGTLTLTASSGVVNWADLAIDLTGQAYVLTFNATGLQGTESNQFDVTTQQPLAINNPASGALPDGVVGTPYSVTITAAGGVPSYSWAIASGSLPAGLNLDPSTGEISGTPTTAGGPSSFSVQVTDQLAATDSRSYTITVLPAGTLTITSPSAGALHDGMTNTAWLPAVSCQAANGTQPYIWDVSAGAMPPGMGIDASTGTISGTPTSSGLFSFTVRVTDNVGATATRNYTITVNDPAPGGTPPVTSGGSSGGGGGCVAASATHLLWPMMLLLIALGIAGRRQISSR